MKQLLLPFSEPVTSMNGADRAVRKKRKLQWPGGGPNVHSEGCAKRETLLVKVRSKFAVSESPTSSDPDLDAMLAVEHRGPRQRLSMNAPHLSGSAEFEFRFSLR